MTSYRIRDWDRHFENNKSRERDACSWCPVPNKQDGLGYGRLMRLKDGAALYGAFVAVVLVCSKQKRPRHGHLTDTGRADGCPYDSIGLSIKTQVAPDTIQRMLDACSDASIGWIEACNASAHEQPAECPPSALEGKKEEKRKKEDRPSASVSSDFDVFWKAYPRKVGKAKAMKAWEKAKSKPVLDAILNALEEQKKQDQWTKDEGKFIPHPTTWINDGRWDDEPVSGVKAKPQSMSAADAMQAMREQS